MTHVLITVDTELSALLHQQNFDSKSNLASSVFGECRQGFFGIRWQMDVMRSHGLRGVFFVDPMPALVYGEDWLHEVVTAIVEQGHEVQLHIHTEWLEWARESPVGAMRGRNLACFSRADQLCLLRCAIGLLERAGAPRPTAFRAGNYGADDNSLRALNSLGLTWDSSVNAAYLGSTCKIGLSPEQVGATVREGVVELPVACVRDRANHIRPAQICALSEREMREALHHAADNKHPAFVIVTHSFEMLSRDRKRANRSVIKRFEAMCRTIAAHPDLVSAGFADLNPHAVTRDNGGALSRLAPNPIRTAARMAEQAVATWRYEHRLRPV
jgi:hypothetical protein